MASAAISATLPLRRPDSLVVLEATGCPGFVSEGYAFVGYAFVAYALVGWASAVA